MDTGGLPGGPRGRGRAPTLMVRVWAPSGIFFAQYFLLFPKITCVMLVCTYGKRCLTNLKCEVFLDCPPYEWQSGTSDGLFLPIYPLTSMRVVLGFDDL